MSLNDVAVLVVLTIGLIKQELAILHDRVPLLHIEVMVRQLLERIGIERVSRVGRLCGYLSHKQKKKQ